MIPVYVIGLYTWSKLARTEWLGNAVYEVPVAGYLRNRLADLGSVDSLDILFLGSSHAYRGFDVRLFDSVGVNSFNFGSSAQTPLQTNVLLKRYLAQLRPKVVIYEVYPLTFTSDGIESTMDLLKNDQLDFEALNLCFKQRSIRTLNGLVLAFADRLTRPREVQIVDSVISTDRYVEGGYVERLLAPPKVKASSTSPMCLVMRANQLEAFDENLDLLRSNGVTVLIVQAPYSAALYQRISNREDFDQLMAAKGDYTNYNKRIQLIDSLHLIDDDHLSQKGVILFNKRLIADIKERMVIR